MIDQPTISRHTLAGLVISYFADTRPAIRAELKQQLLSASNAIIAEELKSADNLGENILDKAHLQRLLPNVDIPSLLGRVLETAPKIVSGRRKKPVTPLVTPFEQASAAIADQCEAAKAEMIAKGETSRTVHIDLSEVDTGCIQIEDPITIEIKASNSDWTACIVESGHWAITLPLNKRLDIARIGSRNPLGRFLAEFVEKYA